LISKAPTASVHILSMRYLTMYNLSTLLARTRYPNGEKYSSTLSLTSVLDVGRWLALRPGRFIPGRLGEPQGRSGRARKISPQP